MNKLFDNFMTLPPVPRVVHEVLLHLHQEALQADTLANLIASDQVICARLLQVANSARFQMPHRISTAHQAVQLLGLVNVRTLVISIGLINCFKQLSPTLLKPLWQHSLRTAVVARHLAPRVGVDAGLAHTCGLLHSIGQLIMQTVQPDLMLALNDKVSPQSPNRMAAEREVLGYDYTDVSAELTRRWEFPELFVQVMQASGHPLSDDVDTKVATMAALVHLSSWYAWASEQSLQTMDDTWPAHVAGSLGLPEIFAEWCMPPWQTLCPVMLDLLD